MLDRKLLWIILTGMVAGATILAWTITTFKHHQPLFHFFQGSYSPADQLLIGISAGIISSLVGIFIVDRLPVFSQLRHLTRDVFITLDPSNLEIPAIALSAGWSEEIVFRGILTPILGNTVTSVIFSLAHVGTNLKVPAFRQYAIAVFIISLGLGWLYLTVGLIASISAHITWDLIVLIWWKQRMSG